MTLADSHIKTLLKEGAARAGAPPSGSEWRMSPDAVARAKELAEEHIRRMGADAARACADAKRSTLKAEDFREETASVDAGSAGMMA
jgi:histone H3/H4